MTASAYAQIPVAVLIGAVLAFVATWFVALAPLRAELRRLRERADEVGTLVTNVRVEAASAAARETALGNVLGEARASAAAAESLVATLRARVGELECELAVERRSLEAMKQSESDVDARLQRVAKSYVEDAREQLLASTTERFEGNAAAFREKINATVAPLNARLEALGASLTTLGTERATDRERVATLLESLDGKMSGIDDATRRVERVLGNSQARGSWGEFELKRLLEMSGMTEHVTFDVQASGYGADGTGRPDVVLRIPGNLHVPIDAKCPFSSYQSAVNAVTDLEREPLLDAAVASIRGHVRVLGTRRYHATERCVGWTIMFVPIEAMLSTLFARDPAIFDAARESRILIASPLTLMLYLEAFARGWAAQKQSENAEAILKEARELVKRLSFFTEKYATVGKRLESALDAYNDSVGSYEGRLGPQARKIVELQGDAPEQTALETKRANVRHLDASRLPAPATLLDAPQLPALRSVTEREAG